MQSSELIILALLAYIILPNISNYLPLISIGSIGVLCGSLVSVILVCMIPLYILDVLSKKNIKVSDYIAKIILFVCKENFLNSVTASTETKNNSTYEGSKDKEPVNDIANTINKKLKSINIRHLIIDNNNSLDELEKILKTNTDNCYTKQQIEILRNFALDIAMPDPKFYIMVNLMNDIWGYEKIN